MELESSYDIAFIDEELRALQDFFEISGKILNEKAVDDAVHESAKFICQQHRELILNDIDSIVEMLTLYYFLPLQVFLPVQLNLGIILWTRPDYEQPELIDLFFRMVSLNEIDNFVKNLAVNPDSTVSLFGKRGNSYWMVEIRMEKTNLNARKLLK